VEVNDLPVLQETGLANGEVLITDAGLVRTDVIKVTVTDPSGNRQIKQKTIQDLLDELRGRERARGGRTRHDTIRARATKPPGP